MKIILFLVLIVISEIKSVPSSCEEARIGTDEVSPSACQKYKAINDNLEECCYLLGTANDGKGEEAECVEIEKKDALSDFELLDIIDDIKEGDYWDDSENGAYDTRYLQIKNIVCKNSKYEISSCEKKTNVEGWNDCKDLPADSSVHTCCYLYDKDKGKKCISVENSDLVNIKEVRDDLYEGDFEGDPTKYKNIEELKCADNKSTASSFVKVSFIFMVTLIFLSFL